MRRGTAMVVAIVLGASAAAGGAFLRAATSPPAYTQIEVAGAERARSGEVVSDRLDDAVTGLRTSSLYVAPEVADGVAADDRAAVERALATAPVPTYLVLWTETTEAGWGTTQYDALDALLPRLGSASDPARVALVTEDRFALVGNIGEATTYADPDLLGGRLGPGLVRYAESLAAEDSVPAAGRSVDGSDDEGDAVPARDGFLAGAVGGAVLGIALGGGIALGLVLLVALALHALARARRQVDR